MVKCPYCDHLNYVEVSDGISEEYEEFLCYNCDKYFLMCSEIDITHKSKKADHLND